MRCSTSAWDKRVRDGTLFALDIWSRCRPVVVTIFVTVIADAFAIPSIAAPFVALHIYYISPAGSDQNNGASPNQAWATPNHSVNCGDVIVAEPGRYEPGQYGTAFAANKWGAVSNCPSISGGIDGKGGIFFAIVLCGGPNMSSCLVNGGASEAFRVDRSNWAVEGFSTKQRENSGNGCMTATSESNEVIAFVAFVNNIASTCGVDGFGTYGWTEKGGVDQSAVVGAIAYNAAPSLGGALCGSGVSMIPVNGSIATQGTHVFVAGYFGYRNINAPAGAGCNTDGEGLVFDSWSCLGGGNAYSHQGVAEQNVWWYNGGPGLEIFPNCQKNGDKSQVYAFGNTSFSNSKDPLHRDVSAELLVNGVIPTYSDNTLYSITKNIFQSTESTCGGNTKCLVYGATVSIDNEHTDLLKIDGNYIFQSDPGVKTSPGIPNTDVRVNGTHEWSNLLSRILYKWWGFPFGSNVYSDPGFANPAALPTAAPDCTAYTNTTDCMNQGYNIGASLRPTAAIGHGYQPPGPCAPDPFFPIWLKGIVFLHWDSSKLTESPGLITKPCNM